MNHLINGVKIIQKYANQSLTTRYWLNSGTIAIHEYQEALPNYDKSARVPKQDWRVASSEEEKLLVADEPGETGTWVSILKMPAEFLVPFKELYECSKGNDVEPLRTLVLSDRLKAKIDGAKTLLHRLQPDPAAPIEGGFIFVGYPGKLTLTFAKGPRYIGLHIDSFYQVPIENRASSPNRICINLGAGDRYLYFINLSVLELKRMLDEVDSSDSRRFQVGSLLGSAFMERFPDYPVVKLKIGPGEAYIAPTENIIHEGSSLGNSHFDINVTFRGHFASGW